MKSVTNNTHVSEGKLTRSLQSMTILVMATQITLHKYVIERLVVVDRKQTVPMDVLCVVAGYQDDDRRYRYRLKEQLKN